jgi:protein involved in polysaccharide export with SLBB domain
MKPHVPLRMCSFTSMEAVEVPALYSQRCSVQRTLERLPTIFCLLKLALTAFTILVMAAYCAQAEETSLGDIDLSEVMQTEADSISSEQIHKALSEAPAGQSDQQALEQFDEPEATIVEVQKETAPAQEELSPIEQLLSGEVSDVVSTRLIQFGYDVFQKPVSTFAPVTDVPVGLDYMIGPGDRFTVTLWGRINEQYPVTVNRSGEIYLPEIGVLKVWGLTFGQLQDFLRHEFSRKHTDFKLATTMDRLRTIRVYVVGEAKAPGSYTISSLSTVINALFAAGGPSKNGTLRKIRLMRTGQEPVTIDIYDFLLGGDKSRDERFKDGDTVFIPLIGSVVGVAGNVKRPAIYEMASQMTLAEVLDLAGGVTYAGWLQRVQVERVENHTKRIVVDFDISEKADIVRQTQAAQTIIQDGDVIKVFPISGAAQNVVYLEGHVIRPGKYELKPKMRLRDIIDSYAMLQPQPNLEYGEIERLVEPDFHPIFIPFNLQKLLDGDESENIELARFDTIRIFRWDERITKGVTISGLVYRPGKYRLIPGMRLCDLLDAAGGLRKNAYLETAELTRRHISQSGMRTEKIDINLGNAIAGDPEHNISLQDYDHLVVRPIPELEFDSVAEVSGEVKFPGTYPLRRGENLSSLLERAGGYTERAYLKGAVFTRENAKSVQRERMDELIRQVEESVLEGTSQILIGADQETVESQRASLQAKRELIARLRAAKIDGRVVIKLASLDRFKQSKYDLELEKGDKLIIPKTPGFVSIVGEVFNPTALLYEKDATVSRYLRMVGGLTKDADKKQLSIVKVDGSVISVAQGNAGRIAWDSESHQWYFGGFMNIRLDPGDTIVVPRKMDNLLWLKMTKDITQILFNVALATGVVLAL